MHATTHPMYWLRSVAHERGLDRVVLTHEVERWIRWVGRFLSAIVLIGSVLAFAEYGAPRGHEYVAWEETASVVSLTVAALGLLIAWFWEPLGAAVALLAGVFVGALAAYQYSVLIALGVALMFMIPAGLFFLAWQRTQTWLSIIAVGAVMGVMLFLGGGMALAFYDQGHGPTHPDSAVAPLPDSAVSWIWSGAVAQDAAVVTAKVVDGVGIRLAFTSTDSFDDARFVASSSRGPVHRFELTGLESDTRYRYAVENAGVLDTTRTGTFATFGGAGDLAIAFAGCARTGSNGAVFDAIRLLEPDLYINTGDLHYGDVVTNSLDDFAALYDLTLSQPGQAALYRSTPIAYVWDDHDFGPNDAAADSPSRQAALLSYRENVPHYEFPLRGWDAPIAQAFSIGEVRFIMTDTRSARDPAAHPDGPDKTMLGAEQLEWFLAELETSLDRYRLVVWVSSVPWIAAAEPGADHWGGYTHERERIANAIAEIGNEGLIMLAGDAHMVAIDDGSNSDYAAGGGGGFPVMQSGALDRNGSVKGGPYSEGLHAGGGQFGLLTIADRGNEISVQMRGMTWDGTELMSLDLVYPDGPS